MALPCSELFRLQDGEKKVQNKKEADDETDDVRHGRSLSQARA
jgi:hypothetical protein